MVASSGNSLRAGHGTGRAGKSGLMSTLPR
jgi:hypothetical protein